MTQKRAYKLVIVESPAKAQTIGKFLGSGYKVEASQGHLRDLPKSKLGIDVDNDFEMQYITIRGRGEILQKIRSEAKGASQVLLATDPDREGEAISWHLSQILGIDPGDNCRVEFHEITKSAVTKAVKEPHSINMGRVDAQQARRAVDRLVGYKISPLLWAKIKKGLSAGRVQSVATRMIVDRENEIEAFVPEEYWEIDLAGKVGKDERKPALRLKLKSVNGEKPVISNEKTAMEIKKKIEAESYTVSSVRQGEKITCPKPPFTTSSLQQEAVRKLNFTTAKTMQVVQQLYEGVTIPGKGSQGLVTYIRTDSVRVNDEALAAVRSHISEKFGEEYRPEKPNIYKGRTNAQDAHEAIRPVNLAIEPDSIKGAITPDQYKLYKLIYNRFVSSQMSNCRYVTLSADISGKTVELRYAGEHKVFPGFTKVYEEVLEGEEIQKDESLPEIAKGDRVKLTKAEPNQFFTQPPARYTEATLIREMEEKGIGRPSTYAPTISTIISRGYVSREKKRLYPTELGKMVNSLMEEYFEDIVATEFTANMEEKLDNVEEGELPWKQVLHAFYPPFEKDLAYAEQQIEKIEIKDEVSDVPCSQCGAMMVYKMSRFGRFLACPNFPNCRNTMPILEYISAPCPKCGSRLMKKTSRKNRVFYGCEKYPECDFVSWDKVSAEKCPKCGSYMVEKRGKNGAVWHVCANETCRHRVEAEQPADEEQADE